MSPSEFEVLSCFFNKTYPGIPFDIIWYHFKKVIKVILLNDCWNHVLFPFIDVKEAASHSTNYSLPPPPPSFWDSQKRYPLRKLTWQMEHPPFEDVFAIENGEFSNVMLVFRVCRCCWNSCIFLTKLLIWLIVASGSGYVMYQEETKPGATKRTRGSGVYYALQQVSYRYCWWTKSCTTWDG